MRRDLRQIFFTFRKATVRVRWFLSFVLVMLGFYGFLRLAFLINNWSAFKHQPSEALLLAFAHGMRFDLSVVLITNAPFVLMALLMPFKPMFFGKLAKNLVWSIFLCINLPLAIWNLGDAEYFKFTGKRSGLELFALWRDLFDQLVQLVWQYYFGIFTCAIFLLGFAFLSKKLFFPESLFNNAVFANGLFISSKPHALTQRTHLKTFFVDLAVVLLLGAFCALGVRGGLQRKPLTPAHAFVFPYAPLNMLTLNSSFTLIHSNLSKPLEIVGEFSSKKEAFKAYRGDSGLSLAPLDQQSIDKNLPNIVILVVESLASEYMGNGINPWKGYTPFLDSLAKQGFLSSHSFANGRRSIDAVWSIFTGIPSLMDEAFVTSPFNSNKIESLPKGLADLGYQAAFFHGGKNGTMYFDVFARMAGFQSYFGMNEYPTEFRERDFDGTWGIFDGPYLSFFSQKLSQFKQPFFSALFTLSSHNPYTIPAEYSQRFANLGKHKMHGSIAYVDFALEQFFEQAKTTNWYNNTIFVVTGDHTSVNTQPSYANPIGEFRVPILLYSPSYEIQRFLIGHNENAYVFQHTDISCTLEGMLRRFFADKLIHRQKSGETHFIVSSPFCSDIFFNGKDNVATLFSGGSYTLFSSSGYITQNKTNIFAPKNTLQSFDNSGQMQNKKLEERLRAAVQLFNNGMLQNSFYLRNGQQD